MKQIELNDLDRRILERLSVDARVSNREIARELGVTEGTIRMRLKRLTDENAIQVVAITNYDHMSDPLVAYLWIDVDSTYPVGPIIEALVAEPQITYVATLIGRADIMAITWVNDASQLVDYLHDRIDQIPGIARIHYELTHKLIKHDYRTTSIVQ
ncbi:transcriptional regulator, AsnC family (plasmid) [Novosphingobium aromaticivorans DSM 12444]|uniref:Transcriptional regulator, AsnC family n=1 Tax=Novosphingobium aromaticivorans (strain ATCC 700278 / DSM 12444 / CCUG 56034 / CIP 105152 / NBRC 16084 / F199) TaxID=279238 RepID=A4XF82_NOVAD|nr:Lrp/AsnC family transcriptional regulator [Novosphingobium aromaticivorans]ABP64593.1 transcriptional regulator, AsnC family [Novosphingobium aromaticivorans DSM 12444]SCY95038.1 transcriptional regulator, AsnC family [Novosphingobium aromaticivorans]